MSIARASHSYKSRYCLHTLGGAILKAVGEAAAWEGMQTLPEEIQLAWAQRDPVAVFTTVDRDGLPNTIYVSLCELRPSARVLIGDVHFSKTLDNLRTGGKDVNLLFFSPDFAAYQLKGRARYASEGALFEEGQSLAKPEFKLRGIVEFQVTAAYKGSEQLM